MEHADLTPYSIAFLTVELIDKTAEGPALLPSVVGQENDALVHEQPDGSGSVQPKCPEKAPAGVVKDRKRWYLSPCELLE